MSDMKMRSLLPLLIAVAAILFPLGSPAQNLISRSDLRRVAITSERSAVGSVVLRIKGAQETVDFTVKQLAEDSFATYFSPNPSFPFQEADITNFFVYSVAPLDRTSEKHGGWARHLEATGGSPPEIPFITDLGQATSNCMSIGKVNDSKLVTGVTNVVGNVTNVIVGIAVPTPNVTDTVSTTLWAPLYTPTANPASRSYNRKGTLAPPSGPEPSPGAKGTINIRFNAAQGRSQFDVRASRLDRGQTYHVFIADTTDPSTNVLVDVGTMTTSGNGSSARFSRDTHFGDPLPLQARDPGDLSGHVIQILDLNGNPAFIHLEGVIP